MSANSAALRRDIQDVSKSFTQFGKTVGATAKAAAAAYVAISAVSKIKDMTNATVGAAATFETLNASLTTVYNSSDVAARKFSELRKFAAETPYTIEEVTEAAIKMRALGLDPTTEALTSMGNTASGMGKDLMQFTEAIADAVTGEMERLKEFGIKSSKEGDNVKFTFQGVTTTVKNNAEEIQKYLLELGDTAFAGGMARQSETLKGKFGQLGGAVTELAATFADSTGLTQATKDASDAFISLANKATGALAKMTAGEEIASLRTQIRELNAQARKAEGLGMSEEGMARFMADHEAKKEIIQERIEMLRQEQNTAIEAIRAQEEAEAEARQKRLEEIQKEKDAKKAAETAESEKERMKKLKESNDKMRELSRDFINKSFEDQAKADAKMLQHKRTFMSHMLTANVNGSKALLNVQKAFRVAEAVMEGKSAVMSAYKWGNAVGGPAVGAAFAAVAGAFSAAQIASIVSGGPSSNTAASVSESAPDVSAPGLEDLAANDEPERTKTITVAFEGEGELLPRSVLRELADELNSLDDSNVRISV
jgi:hypothetical protein